MAAPERASLDERRITAASQSLAADLFARFPGLRAHACMERAAGDAPWRLVVRAPALSREPGIALEIWLDGSNEEPSVAFGAWHTHETVWASIDDRPPRQVFLDLIAGILDDRRVLGQEIGGEGDGCTSLLDLADPDALLDELTSKGGHAGLRLHSWSGRFDRVVRLEDLGPRG